MQIKRIALGGIIMTVIMFSGCSTTVQNLAIGEEKTLETGKTEQDYISQIQQNGPNTKIEVFKGLSHGFGLGEGTVAEGWIDRAISFWEDNMNALDKR